MPYQIGILSAMPEVIFAALAQAEHEPMDKTVSLPSERSVHIWGFVLMSENFIPTSHNRKILCLQQTNASGRFCECGNYAGSVAIAYQKCIKNLDTTI